MNIDKLKVGDVVLLNKYYGGSLFGVVNFLYSYPTDELVITYFNNMKIYVHINIKEIVKIITREKDPEYFI